MVPMSDGDSGVLGPVASDAASAGELVPVRSADFVAIYGEHHARLVRLAYLIVGSITVAEDITQEAFAKLLERLDRVDNPGGWLRIVVVNGARNEIRWREARRRVAKRLHGSVVVDGVDVAPDLVASLRRLPARQRAVVVLRFYEDMAESDIAHALGIRVGTVKSTLHRALGALREELGEVER
jgi:RNA polymerase sigma-70 factor (sigma-E family)